MTYRNNPCETCGAGIGAACRSRYNRPLRTPHAGRAAPRRNRRAGGRHGPFPIPRALDLPADPPRAAPLALGRDTDADEAPIYKCPACCRVLLSAHCARCGVNADAIRWIDTDEPADLSSAGTRGEPANGMHAGHEQHDDEAGPLPLGGANARGLPPEGSP